MIGRPELDGCGVERDLGRFGIYDCDREAATLPGPSGAGDRRCADGKERAGRRRAIRRPATAGNGRSEVDDRSALARVVRHGDVAWATDHAGRLGHRDREAAVARLPAASVVLNVLVVTPSGNPLPLASPAVCTVVAPGHASVPTGAVYVTTAEPEPGGFSVAAMLAGQVRAGFSTSLTVTVKLHEASGATPFEAVLVTVDVPTGKACGELIGVAPILVVTVGAGQPAVAVGGVKETSAVHAPGSVLTV